MLQRPTTTTWLSRVGMENYQKGLVKNQTNRPFACDSSSPNIIDIHPTLHVTKKWQRPDDRPKRWRTGPGRRRRRRRRRRCRHLTGTFSRSGSVLYLNVDFQLNFRLFCQLMPSTSRKGCISLANGRIWNTNTQPKSLNERNPLPLLWLHYRKNPAWFQETYWLSGQQCWAGQFS